MSRTPDQDELNHQELVTTSRLPGGEPGSAAKARTAATAFLTTRDGVVLFDAPPAHMAASTFMLSGADQLWAVWDGKPARGYGGTADVVAWARENHVPVTVIWPDGAHRD